MSEPADGAHSPTQILIVEDNPADVLLLRYAFTQTPEWSTELVVVEDGEEAIRYFLSHEEPKPDLVILDLNLPKRDGTEVLRVIRTTYSAFHLPVIVFSSSPEDVVRSRVHQAHVTADCYITKPLGIDLVMMLPKQFRSCYEDSLQNGAAGPDRSGK